MINKTSEWEWEAFTVAGLDAYSRARRSEAIYLWQKAADISSSFAVNDPRRATSQNNASISSLLDANHEHARRGFEDALKLWSEGLAWTNSMTVSPMARSSLFHFRMERRHTEAFTEVRRSRSKILLDGAVALTRFNLALSSFFLDIDDAGDQLLEQALAEREQACGRNNLEFIQIARVISGRHDMSGRAKAAQEIDETLRTIDSNTARSAREVWHQEQPGELTDMRRLLASAYLTAVVHERDFL